MSTYPWKRFWVRRAGTMNLSDRGYLVDPEGEHGSLLNPDIVPEEHLRLAPCMALLGEPGVGKTAALGNEFDTARREGHQCLHIDLRDFSSDSLLVRTLFDAPQLRAWQEASHTLTLFLDSLDECLVHVRTVARLLVGHFRDLPRNRLRLRIACRTVDWPETLSQELPKLWGRSNYAEVELAPLRRCDVSLAAQAEGLEAERFLEKIEAGGLVSFAIRPSTLRFLTAESRGGRQLPTTVRDMFERGCLELCRERSPSRHDSGAMGSLTPGQRLDVADRIAAATLLGRHPSIFLGSDVNRADPGGDLLPEDLAWGVSADRPVTREDVREVLGTELFSGREGQRLGWSHWTFAEYLAARFIHRVELSDAQAADLLLRRGVDGRERVIPQLREVGAWVASERPALLRRIAAGDPQVLLRPSLGQPERLDVARALLDLADRGEISDGDLNRLHYRTLSHPEMGRLLDPYFLDRKRNRVVRRMAIDIAEACDCKDLVPDLLSVALAPDEDSHTRVQAAYAASRLGDEGRRAQLRPLLDATPQEDPDDELKGVALDALWPKQISPQDLFENWLTAPHNPHLFGAYWMFVRSLSERLEPWHLTAALQWVARQDPDHFQQMHLSDLAAAIMRSTWASLDDPAVLAAFVSAAVHRLADGDPLFTREPGDARQDPVIGADAPRRRLLLDALIDKVKAKPPNENRVLFTGTLDLVQASDFEWLLQQEASAPDSEGRAWWLELIDRRFNRDSLEHAEALLAGVSASPALRDKMRVWMEPVALGSTAAREMRSAHEQIRRLTEAPRRRRVTHPPLRVLIEGWLDKAEAGDPDAWWRLNRDLTLPEDSDYYPLGGDYKADLTTLPGWQALDHQGRDRVIEAAARYVRTGDPADTEWLGTNTFYPPAAAGYRALRLLMKERPAALGGLRPEDWARWAASILAFWGDPEEGEEAPMLELVGRAYRGAPEVVLRAFEALVDKDNREHGTVFIAHKLARAWDRRLADAILSKVEDNTLQGPAVAALLEPLLTGFPDLATPVALALVQRRSEPAPQPDRAQFAAVALLQHAPGSAWGVLWPCLQDDPPFGKAVFETLASRWHLASKPRLLAEVPEAALAELYVWLRREIPEERSRRFGAVAPRESLIDLRDAILDELKQRATKGGVLALRRIADALPHLPWLRFACQEAEEMLLRDRWLGVDQAVLKEMAVDRKVRVVDTAEQLVDVILESLFRLQARLQGETPAVSDLWNDRPATPKDEAQLSDYVKRHLADDLSQRGVVANREVQVHGKDQVDIRVDAIGGPPDPTPVSVVVEVKGCWNRGLQRDMAEQLRDRYLRDTGPRHRIYLVGWFLSDAWSDKDYRKRSVPRWTLSKAKRVFETQATGLSVDGFMIKAVVLDCSRGRAAPRSGARNQAALARRRRTRRTAALKSSTAASASPPRSRARS